MVAMAGHHCGVRAETGANRVGQRRPVGQVHQITHLAQHDQVEPTLGRPVGRQLHVLDVDVRQVFDPTPGLDQLGSVVIDREHELAAPSQPGQQLARTTAGHERRVVPGVVQAGQDQITSAFGQPVAAHVPGVFGETVQIVEVFEIRHTASAFSTTTRPASCVQIGMEFSGGQSGNGPLDIHRKPRGWFLNRYHPIYQSHKVRAPLRSPESSQETRS